MVGRDGLEGEREGKEIKKDMKKDV